MQKKNVTIGMQVTLTEAIYGEHFGRPYPKERCWIKAHSFLVQPGMVGVVASVNVPVVHHTPGNPTSFVCVDFIDPETGCRFRVRPWYHQIKAVKTAAVA
jgi:hypothetical protein